MWSTFFLVFCCHCVSTNGTDGAPVRNYLTTLRPKTSSTTIYITVKKEVDFSLLFCEALCRRTRHRIRATAAAWRCDSKKRDFHFSVKWIMDSVIKHYFSTHALYIKKSRKLYQPSYLQNMKNRDSLFAQKGVKMRVFTWFQNSVEELFATLVYHTTMPLLYSLLLRLASNENLEFVAR